jgi:hypothetical protein
MLTILLHCTRRQSMARAVAAAAHRRGVTMQPHYDGSLVTDVNVIPAPFPRRAAELAARPDAVRWAHDCAWVPGTGYCPASVCSRDCAFRDQRDAEAERVLRGRRRRR